MTSERLHAKPDFRQLLGELTTGGVVIVDRFPGRDDEQVAFRTLLQLDGDVLLAIHADALARPDFAELLAQHQAHVCKVLDAKGQRLKRLSTGFGVAVGVLGLGAGASFGGLAADLQSLSVEWAIAAASSVGGVLLWAWRRALGEVGLRLLLRRWAFARLRRLPAKL
jgi:hypothetical protein